MPFVIRSEGFMYNDEYNAPVGHRLVRVRRAYETREQAEDVLERLHRQWLRAEPEIFEDHLAWESLPAVVQEVTALVKRLRPDEDLNEAWISGEATDDELDELVRVARFELAEVCEVDDVDEALQEEQAEWEEVYYGDGVLFDALRRYDPAPWPPAPPTPAQLVEANAALQVAWDWVASAPTASPAPRQEAKQRARTLGLDWHEPVHRALVSYTPDLAQLRSLLGPA